MELVFFRYFKGFFKMFPFFFYWCLNLSFLDIIFTPILIKLFFLFRIFYKFLLRYIVKSIIIFSFYLILIHKKQAFHLKFSQFQLTTEIVFRYWLPFFQLLTNDTPNSIQSRENSTIRNLQLLLILHPAFHLP